jgi:hypothetical protein
MEQAWPYIIGIAQLVGMLLLYIHQRNIIRSQKIAIESMQTYHQMFDIEKVKSYVSLAAETQKMELEKAHKLEVEEMKQALERSKADTNKVGELLLHRQDTEHKLRWELMNGAIGLIYEQPRDKRKEFIRKLFPLNSDILISMIEDISAKVPTL